MPSVVKQLRNILLKTQKNSDLKGIDSMFVSYLRPRLAGLLPALAL
jgi:hypothetical protein